MHISRPQTGYTLVELMVALLIGLLLIGGVVEIFINSKQTYRMDDALGRVQENARFAFEQMSRDIRMAGVSACGDISEIPTNVIANPPLPPVAFNLGRAVTGTDNTGLNGSDTLTIGNAGECGAYLTGNMGVTNANVQFTPNNSCNFQAGDVLLITDCQSMDIFRATNVSSGAAQQTIAHSNAQNTSNFLSKAYQAGTQVMRFSSRQYFLANNPNNQPALFMTDITGANTELVEGVENMQIQYGVDNNNDGAADTYLTAAGGVNWNNVVSVRLELLLRTLDDNLATQAQTLTYNGAAFVAPDGRLRRVITHVVSLRNKVP